MWYIFFFNEISYSIQTLLHNNHILPKIFHFYVHCLSSSEIILIRDTILAMRLQIYASSSRKFVTCGFSCQAELHSLNYLAVCGADTKIEI